VEQALYLQKINPLYQGWETFCLTARQRKHEYDSKKGHQWTFSPQMVCYLFESTIQKLKVRLQ
jgi:hypothetical protein